MNIQKSQNLFVNWEKVGKYLRTTLKNPNFESMDQLGKVIHISDIMRYFITLVKVFPIWDFWTHWEFCAHHRIFGFKKDPEYLYWSMISIWWFMIYIAISSPENLFRLSLIAKRWTGNKDGILVQLTLIVGQIYLVLSLPAESYIEDTLLVIYWSITYWDILSRAENLKNS